MPHTPLSYTTPDGTADARLGLPGTPGPWPLVVLCMDAFGLRPALDSIADRLVAAGYAVVQPDLYWPAAPTPPSRPAPRSRTRRSARASSG